MSISRAKVLTQLNVTVFSPLSFAFHTSSLSVLTSVRVRLGLVQDIINCLQWSTFLFDKMTVPRLVKNFSVF